MPRSRIWEVCESLIRTAKGIEKADLVIKNCTLVNVYSGEILDKIDIAVRGDRIAYVGKDASHTIGDKTEVLDAKGKYVAPGFLDAHVHIESSMLTLTQFARGILPHGTTAIFADPHEIANVLGSYGVKLLAEEAKHVPLKVYLQLPSCVPASSPEFETAGAVIDADEVERLIAEEYIHSLGEMMNFPGVVMCDPEVMRKIKATLKAGKVATGHAPELMDKELAAYAASGVSSCHENTRWENAIEKLRMGIWTIIREGSAWRDVKDVIKMITERKADHRRVLLATDDRHADDILYEGHMDYVIRRAIEEGADPVRAIQMATVNTAVYYGVDLDIGGIAPPRYADIVVLDDLTKVKVDTVIADGKVVARSGKITVEFKPYTYPERARRTINLKKKIEPRDLELRVKIREGLVKAHVIEVIPAKTLTRHVVEEVPVKNYVAEPSIDKDVILAAVIERHHATGNIGLGFVKGTGIRRGAFASSVAHDSHNIVVIGTSREDMALAVNKLAEVGGGMIVVSDGKVNALVELPIAGLMSDEPIEVVAEKVKRLGKALRELGCELPSPFMTFSLLALTVLPELRLSDKGLIDTVKMRKIDPVEV
ncbi:MAG: adenine deaminase [Thermoprotei archaeon]|nr:MAG: adenine deaminase [Thermoprotei archaeon]RLF24353.1 MAG: adenine deaminase [Thermoprotei archaeon]